jgi:hypothetical protein
MIEMPGVNFALHHTKHLKVKASKLRQCKEMFLNTLVNLEEDEIPLKALYGLFQMLALKLKRMP